MLGFGAAGEQVSGDAHAGGVAPAGEGHAGFVAEGAVDLGCDIDGVRCRTGTDASEVVHGGFACSGGRSGIVLPRVRELDLHNLRRRRWTAIPGAAQDASNGAPFEEMSVERLGELSEFDAVLYPLGPDGKPTPAMVPLLESNAWKSLPLVQSDKALPVVCPYGTMTYTSGILNLKSLDEALGLAITAG